jgi:putative copper export protein/mono/diheme cytochrome c family protein
MDEMNSLLVVSRALHFAAVLLMFGGLVLTLVVDGPATRTAQPAGVDVNERVRIFLRTAGWWGWGVSLLSGAIWLVVEAALMSGRPIAEAASGGTLWLVLARTGFGRVWMWRFGIAVVLGALMFATATRNRRSLRRDWVAIALAGGYLAPLALVGHAADGHGTEQLLRIATDVVHLLAAGAWLGALPGLTVLFVSALRTSSTYSLGIAARAAQRFSPVGIASVGALLLSGLFNAWYLVGDVPALLGTHYGQLLVAKIALFLTMVALAITNRQRLTPRVEERGASALRLLTRNAVLEIVAGVAAVAIVGALGVAIPAAHQPPVWPFGFALSLAPIEESVRARWLLGACITATCAIMLALAFARAQGKRIGPRYALILGSAVTTAVMLAIGLLVEPAYPTSYVASPVKYTAQAIARGGASYNTNCAQCHGLHGRGDGPAAATLPIKPVDLVEHASHHRSGDLFWWVAHGIPNTPMPAFSSQLDDEELWTLVQYLRALSESQTAQALTASVEPFLPITAPDFAFEESPLAQETLVQLRGHEVLLVMGVLPESLPRMRQIEAQRTNLERAGIRMILMATGRSPSLEGAGAIPGAPRLAIFDSDTMKTYAMFACGVAISCASSIQPLVEWLVDRGGYLRARWLGVPDADVDRTAEIMAGAHQLQREPFRPPAQHEHGH